MGSNDKVNLAITLPSRIKHHEDVLMELEDSFEAPFYDPGDKLTLKLINQILLSKNGGPSLREQSESERKSIRRKMRPALLLPNIKEK